LISILGFGSLAGRLVLGHAADRFGRQRILGVLHVALGMLFLTWTIRTGFVTLGLFAFAYGVCYGATIALRPAVIADHFAGPDLAAVTGLHYTSSVLGSLVGPAAFGYSVDFWNSDLIASCVAAACLIAAGYFFAAKPPQVRPRRASICAASAAPCENAGLYRFPAFGAAGHVTAGNGSIRSHWRRRLYRRATRGSDRALLLRSSPEHPSLQWVPSL